MLVSTRMSRGRNVLLILFGLFLGLALGEAALRIYFAVAPDPPRSRYLKDKDCGFLLRPGPFWEDNRYPDDRVNAFGFRDREHAIPKPPGTYRILGIGDSFVLGPTPISNNFLRVAERRLREAAGADSSSIDVAMMGLGGYSPENYLGVLRSAGLKLDPDLVVVCFYIGNDVTEIPKRGEVLAGELYFSGSPNPWKNLLRRSRLFAFVERFYITHSRLANLHEVAERETAGDASIPDPNLYYLLVQKNRIIVYDRAASPMVEGLWRRAEACLDEIDRLCRAAGVPWILLLEPDEIQVDPVVRERVARALRLSESRYDFDQPNQRLAEFARSRGIELLDLLPAFREAQASGERLYIPNDTHWNVEGNLLAGKELADAIRGRMGIKGGGQAGPAGTDATGACRKP